MNESNNENWDEVINSDDFSNEVEKVVLGHTCDSIISERLFELFNHQLGDEVRAAMKRKYGEGIAEAMVEEYGEEVEDAIAAAFVKWLKKYKYIQG